MLIQSKFEYFLGMIQMAVLLPDFSLTDLGFEGNFQVIETEKKTNTQHKDLLDTCRDARYYRYRSNIGNWSERSACPQQLYVRWRT